MAEAGDGDLVALLTEEHDSIRAVADELTPLARAAAAGPLAAAETAALKRLMTELVERQVAHIQKESMACCRCSTTCWTKKQTASSRSRTLRAERS